MAADINHLEVEAQRVGATIAMVDLPVSTGRGTENPKKETFNLAMPKTLADAVKIEGEQKVFERYISALAIAIQAEKRRELGDTGEGKKERKRAPYLQSLGI